MRRRNRRTSGFMMMRLLLSLMICTVMLPIELAALNLLLKYPFYDSWMQDEISLAQLRRVLNVCYGKVTEGNTLICEYQGQRTEFRQVNGFLAASPGTWIFLDSVEEVNWEMENGFVKLSYCRGQERFERVMAFE